ncbi:hypothetical protein Tco_1422925 [Tanacetum coccineum]
MYLTASRPDIMFAVCVCARHQVTPKASHLNAVKMIFSDYRGDSLDRKSTTGGYQFLGRRLISCQCKKKTIVANSTTETEYVATANYLLTKGFDVTRFNFLVTATIRTLANGIQELVASIDNKEYTITEASVRSKLQLADATGAMQGNMYHCCLQCWQVQLRIKVKAQQTQLNPILHLLIQFHPYHNHQFHLPLNHLNNHHHLGKLTDRKLRFLSLRVLLSSTHVVDEATTTRVGVETKGDTTIIFGLDAGLDSGNIHESPLRSHEAPLHEGHTSGSAEDSLQLKELMVLVPKMVTRIDNLEKELHHTKKTYGKAVLTLVKRVKSLEVALKKRTKKVVVSDSEYEETENQGRKIQDIDDDPLVSLVRESMKEADFVTPIKDSASREAQEEEISPTILEAAKTLSQVASQTISTYKRRVWFLKLNGSLQPIKDDSLDV